ncbi:MAG: aminotransferase class I/II-fold pyridoxal phosphate-dependent enzyme [Clostridia bacterium]|nr:aminotransferase class I/II-fold pyridoxal phosphate-dependent enzyme [Clostridia bacterium]
MFDYTKVLASTVKDMKPSGIRKFFDLLQGREDVVGLTVGQPDFVTPWHIREAGIDSLKEGKTYYTSNAGLGELRIEIAKYLDRRFSLKYDGMSEVVVTVGGSEAIDLAIRACVETGDEVIIPTPCFVCYEPCVKLAGGVPVILETKAKNNFKVTPDELKALITPRTKMLILAYPNNPTGAILTENEMRLFAGKKHRKSNSKKFLPTI